MFENRSTLRPCNSMYASRNSIMMPLLVQIMRGAVAFNYKLSFATIEIRDVTTKLMLAPKFESQKLSIPGK